MSGSGGAAMLGEYVRIPAGTFVMGSDFRMDETPPHEQTITRDYFMKITEVTQGEWTALMGNNPSGFRDCGPDCPVEMVSWEDALAYANALSQQEGLPQCYTLSGCRGTPGTSGNDLLYLCAEVTFAGVSCPGYRLPTEAEWEHAARAGTTTAFYTGDITQTTYLCRGEPNLDAAGWYCHNSAATYGQDCSGLDPEAPPMCGPQPVGGKQPNAWGLHDMLGNVWEWTGDCHGAYPTDDMPDYSGSPEADSSCTGVLSANLYRVTRGGSWDSSAPKARAAMRMHYQPGLLPTFGFRTCRTVVP
jgi:formylglycine-generating enzyme required for sulfatase activity